jgi:hypothetical protein
MKLGGQLLDAATIARMQGTIDAHPALSRTALSRRLCAELDWHAPNGRPREMSCRAALVKLDRQGALRLPPAQPFGGRCGGRRAIAVAPLAPLAPLAVVHQQSLAELQPVELLVVDRADRAASRVWRELMERYHYLGAGPLCGAQVRYLIRRGAAAHDWLGGLAFSAAAWRVEAREEWIGWSDAARERHLPLVVCNSRFVLVPPVQVPHLASHVLGLALQRVGEDFHDRYGYAPLLVETFIDPARFAGTCYRAANFIEVGQTRGRGRQDRAHRGEAGVKRVFVYPLHAEARARLCAEPAGAPSAAAPAAPTPTAPVAPPTPVDWAEEEFGTARLPDRRLTRRLVSIARDFFARPQAQIPQACQSRAKTKAAYRFFQHPEATMDVLLEPHRQATYRRIAGQRVVLCPQDTTSLNYSAHPATVGLGPIGSVPDGVIGLLVHDTMAFSVAGTPLGLLDVQWWARDAEEFGQKHERRRRPIEAKESYKWLRSFQQVADAQRHCPDTMLVSLGDREADIYELFHRAATSPGGPKLLVRAEQDRLLAEGQGPLWSAVQAQPLAGVQEVQLPRRGTTPGRVARLEVRFAEVTLQPPKGKSQLGAVQLWAVVAQEGAPPEGSEPLSWLLLTTVPVTSVEQAVERLDWYTKRWGIEVYHKTLKSGCKVEARQLGSAQSLQACLAIDLVVAWRVYHLAQLGRETPDVPCTVFFEEAEWKALLTFVTKTPVVDGAPPSLREAMRLVASLGGFLGRKDDGEPGTKSLWLGLQRLDDITAAWEILVPHLQAPLSVQQFSSG